MAHLDSLSDKSLGCDGLLFPMMPLASKRNVSDGI